MTRAPHNGKRLVPTNGQRFRPAIEPLEDRRLLSTCNVTQLRDTGTGNGLRGDLRYCIDFANNNPGEDTIKFGVTGVINLKTVLPHLTGKLRIEGPGADQLTVQRDPDASHFRILYVDAGATVDIAGLTVANGRVNLTTGGGSGIFNDGTLNLSHCTVTGNYLDISGYQGGGGGGIYNGGTLFLSASTVSGNYAHTSYPFDARGGGIYNAGPLIVADSTISGNKAYASFDATGLGGGIYNKNSTLLMVNSTVSHNSCTF